jgi:predicted enzyme involved in methoxymalonyl-ACP biosynthesis
MVLREILDHARATGINKLIGIFKPTERNQLVVDHHAALGFIKLAEEQFGITHWELPVECTSIASPLVRVFSQGF